MCPINVVDKQKISHRNVFKYDEAKSWTFCTEDILEQFLLQAIQLYALHGCFTLKWRACCSSSMQWNGLL